MWPRRTPNIRLIETRATAFIYDLRIDGPEIDSCAIRITLQIKQGLLIHYYTYLSAYRDTFIQVSQSELEKLIKKLINMWTQEHLILI